MTVNVIRFQNVGVGLYHLVFDGPVTVIGTPALEPALILLDIANGSAGRAANLTQVNATTIAFSDEYADATDTLAMFIGQPTTLSAALPFPVASPITPAT